MTNLAAARIHHRTRTGCDRRNYFTSIELTRTACHVEAVWSTGPRSWRDIASQFMRS